MRYTPALDGIRCYAVLVVAMYHFFIFAGGWIGVQTFFVLSGFLITALLLEAKTRHKATFFRRFYFRRIVRIFPLYYLYLAVTALGFVLIAIPPEFLDLWPYLVTFTSNFTRMGVYDRGGEYFVHFWSLAVEEQYYLVWPLIVFALPLSGLRRLVVGLLIGVPLLRLLVGELLQGQGLGADQVVRSLGVFPLMQFDAFAAGALLAVLPIASYVRRPTRLAVAAVSTWVLAGVAMLVTARFSHVRLPIDSLGHHATLVNYYHVWGNSLTNLASAAVILAAVEGAFASLLANRLVVHIGRVSYGVYILHLPLHDVLTRLVPYRHSSPTGLLIFVLYFLATVGLATLSYRWFESPFLRLKDKFDASSAPLSPVSRANSGSVRSDT